MPTQQTRIRTVHSAQGAVVMDIDRGTLFSLNGTGSVMYELLAKGLDERTILDELRRRFNISVDTAKQDLSNFQNALRLHAIHPERHTPSRNAR